MERTHRPRAARPRKAPRCIVIAGPNGAGKTTFAREYLPKGAKVVHFVNTDQIASGLSPIAPELAAVSPPGESFSENWSASRQHVLTSPLRAR